MNNGHSPLSMRISPGYDKDPLRRPKHRVLTSEDGVNFTIMGSTDEPLELLKLSVEGQHALGFKDATVKIVAEDHTVVADYPSYHAPAEEGPPSEARLRLRDRWLEAVMRFLLPARLYEVKGQPEKAKVLARWFKKHRIAIELRPDGGAVRIYRNGDVLSEWGC